LHEIYSIVDSYFFFWRIEQNGSKVKAWEVHPEFLEEEIKQRQDILKGEEVEK